ncbi:MAG: outer membrane lipid asymmetry maintenance protein MlaD [Deltaproteobacteria bacterium]|nr:MAG: outer membrane lipid asymmetry maintenance protein MlaD [Deltaproteobacteria bacterium]
MKKYSSETVVGIFVLIGLLCVGYMTLTLGKVSLFGDDSYILFARFNTVTGLKPDNRVEMFGIEIGRVTGFRIDQANQVAIVEMKIKKGIKIYDDAVASIRTSGLIGDRYVSMDPGGSGDLLEAGATITDTESPVNIEELISKYAFGDVKKQ